MGGGFSKILNQGWFGMAGEWIGDQMDKGPQKAERAAQALEAQNAADMAALATDKEALKAKNLRSSLFKTAGASSGEEIMSGGTTKRSTIFGNA
jgi:hypothetical protein